ASPIQSTHTIDSFGRCLRGQPHLLANALPHEVEYRRGLPSLHLTRPSLDVIDEHRNQRACLITDHALALPIERLALRRIELGARFIGHCVKVRAAPAT